MGSLGRIYNNHLETLISVFTIDKGSFKVLLLRKKTEPYKGYWILPGNYLKNDEINQLIKDLKNCENPFSCPHGRPTFIKMTQYEIEKMFKRV